MLEVGGRTAVLDESLVCHRPISIDYIAPQADAYNFAVICYRGYKFSRNTSKSCYIKIANVHASSVFDLQMEHRTDLSKFQSDCIAWLWLKKSNQEMPFTNYPSYIPADHTTLQLTNLTR